MFCDLKASFGEKKDGTPGEEEKINWDQNVETEEEKLPESLHTADANVAPEESTGFQFSFFGDDIETGGTEAGGCDNWRQPGRFVFIMLLLISN